MTSAKPRSKPYSHQARPGPPPPLADPETPGSGFQSSEVAARVGRGQQRPALPREPAGPRCPSLIPLLWLSESEIPPREAALLPPGGRSRSQRPRLSGNNPFCSAVWLSKNPLTLFQEETRDLFDDAGLTCQAYIPEWSLPTSSGKLMKL